MLIEEIEDILTDLLQFMFDLCPVFLDVWKGGAVAFGLRVRASCVSSERVVNIMMNKRTSSLLSIELTILHDALRAPWESERSVSQRMSLGYFRFVWRRRARRCGRDGGSRRRHS